MFQSRWCCDSTLNQFCTRIALADDTAGISGHEASHVPSLLYLAGSAYHMYTYLLHCWHPHQNTSAPWLKPGRVKHNQSHLAEPFCLLSSHLACTVTNCTNGIKCEWNSQWHNSVHLWSRHCTGLCKSERPWGRLSEIDLSGYPIYQRTCCKQGNLIWLCICVVFIWHHACC